MKNWQKFLVVILIAISIIGVVLAKMSPSNSAVAIVAPPSSQEVEAAINRFRIQQGLQPLGTDNPVLDEAAQVRAEQMCADNDWSHNKAWDVLNKYYQYSFASENLYYNSLLPNQVTDAVEGWRHSPAHLKGMLADNKEVGVGVKYCPGYQGVEDAVVITSYFGVPR